LTEINCEGTNIIKRISSKHLRIINCSTGEVTRSFHKGHILAWRDNTNHSSKWFRSISRRTIGIDCISTTIQSYHIAKSTSGSRLKCVFLIASKYFLVLKESSFSREKKNVWGKNPSASALRITLKWKSFNERNDFA